MKIGRYKKVENRTKYTTAKEYVDSFLEKDSTITRYNVMREDATVLACVDLIASTIATMTIQLYKKTDEGTKHINNNLTYLLAGRANKTISSFNLIRDFIRDYLLNKDSFIAILHEKGEVTELRNLDKTATSMSKVVYKNDYIIDTTLDEKSVKFAYDSVLHIADIEDRFLTIENICLAKKYCSTLVTNYFKSDGSKPLKGILKTDDNLDEESMKFFLDCFVAKMQKTGYSMLDNNIDFQQLTQSSTFQEMLVNELKEDLDNEIFKCFRVPKSLVIGDGKESSYASLNVIQQQFVKSLLPIIKQLEQELNYKLLSKTEIEEGYYFKLNTKNAMRMTPLEQAQYYKVMTETGLYSVNDVLDLEDRDRIEGGDSHRVSLNFCDIEIANTYQLSRSGFSKEEVDSTIDNK
ncbi:phage portal protein [Clostridium tertium]|uniref:phage portal protein n=1 Tax=Clostridium tertium TaxID=1559 RepID=UPI0024B33618|nr:phage portal protein [Clostridium tertium]MDI9216005.1 phage portal protein [Clostridium tertium]